MKERGIAISKRLAVIYVTYLLAAMALQRVAMYPGTRIEAPPLPPRDAQLWKRSTPDGDVEALHYAGSDVVGTVLYAHGNGELVDHQAGIVSGYLAMKYRVVLPEFRGYGRSSGSPSQDEIASDMLHFAKRAREEFEGPLVCHGFSMGGAAVGTIINSNVCDVVILESTFTSTAEVARFHPIPRFLFWDRYETLNAVRRSTAPLLVMHGSNDTMIGIEHGEALAAARPHTTFVTFEAGHNLPRGRRYWRTISQFIVAHR